MIDTHAHILPSEWPNLAEKYGDDRFPVIVKTESRHRIYKDGKFFRVEGRATFPESPPADSLVIVDASRFPPVVKTTVESGIEHTVQGPPQAVAITTDGKLAIVAAPTRYDYAAKKELFDNFVQVVDLEASPPTVARVDVGAHANGLTIKLAKAGGVREVEKQMGDLLGLDFEGFTRAVILWSSTSQPDRSSRSTRAASWPSTTR